MAEIIATVGLVWAAKCLTKKQENIEYFDPAPPPVSETQGEIDHNYQHRSTITDTFTGGAGGVGVNHHGKQEMPSFGDVSFMKHVNGEPVRDFRDRPYVSGKMNNLSPADKTLVGPGLNVGPDVPAYGGNQQLFRVNPTNVGAYKLTTLPGRSGPAGNITGGKGQLIGTVTHDKPATTAYLPSRLPNVQGKAQGQGGSLNGVVPRGEYQRSKRTTNRSETTSRGDGLEFAPAKKFISAGTLADDPTRNKGDINVLQYSHVNNPSPSINSYHGGYTNSPGVMYMENGGNAQDYGIRPTDRRGKKDRAANGGRMNVRADPLNQHGMVTAVRSDTSRMDGWKPAANGGWSQNYVQPMYQQNNAFKGNINPNTQNLNLAVNQLKNNPLAHSISS
jgi:hypothetical protein